jgi:hypothetical protein
MELADKVVAYVHSLAGAGIQEIQPNQGWQPNVKYPTFTQDMKSVGWYVGGEWCMFSAMLVWKKNMDPKLWAYVSKLLNGNSISSADNCHKDKYWPTGVIPKPGCIVIWQLGNSTTKGHAGVCTTAVGSSFTSGEGNSSAVGDTDTRTGWTYAEHAHILNRPHSDTNLNLYRCIYLPDDDLIAKMIG